MNEIALGAVDINNAKEGCYQCEILEREIARQKSLGLDVTEEELRLAALKNFYQGVLTIYGPLVGTKGRKATDSM